MNADWTDGRCRVVGTKQLIKKLNRDEISALLLARDAQREITDQLIALAGEKQVPIRWIDSMQELGKMCGIAVGSAAAGLLRRT